MQENRHLSPLCGKNIGFGLQRKVRWRSWPTWAVRMRWWEGSRSPVGWSFEVLDTFSWNPFQSKRSRQDRKPLRPVWPELSQPTQAAGNGRPRWEACLMRIHYPHMSECQPPSSLVKSLPMILMPNSRVDYQFLSKLLPKGWGGTSVILGSISGSLSLSLKRSLGVGSLLLQYAKDAHRCGWLSRGIWECGERWGSSEVDGAQVWWSPVRIGVVPVSRDSKSWSVVQYIYCT